MPYHAALPDALEFEVLVGRGARRGGLALAELSESYAALAAALSLDAAEPGALAIDTLTEALLHLPEGFARAHKLVAVAALDDFALPPIDPKGAPCARGAGAGRDGPHTAPLAAAWLDPQTLLIACPDGLCSLNGLVMALCTIAHESRKWCRLRIAAAAPQAAPDAPSEPSQAHLALAGGVSLVAWQKADTAAGGQLAALLTHWPLPELQVHPDISPRQQAAAAIRCAGRIVSAIAEMGLLRRPLHLWVGPAVVVDVLSPYSRDLGPQLLAWAQERDMPHTQEDIYAVLGAFASVQPQLVDEQHAAEASVGIQRLRLDSQLFGSDAALDIVDFARLDAAACDPALICVRAAQRQGLAPVLLRLPAALGQPLATLFDSLVESLGEQLTSVTVVAQAVWQPEQMPRLAHAHTHLPWHKGAAAIQATLELSKAEAARLAAVHCFIDVPMPQNSCPQALIDALEVRGHGVSFGQMPLACALARLGAARAASGQQPLATAIFVAAPEAQNPTAQAPLTCARLETVCQPPIAKSDAPAAPPPAPRRSGHRLRV